MPMDSNFGRSFLFLTNLAWKIRVALPALILVGSMVFDFRWEIEINIHTERIALPDGGARRQRGGAGDEVDGVGVAIDHLMIETSDEEEFTDEDFEEGDDYSDENDDDMMFVMDV
ncbi:uncharacterized protein LOC128270572 [Anopheles cruzii]|uniref:uncharacterized protein LOC128270572 n=1 Tax=Anopheles cruzii TaxID=68878 RepID=UPI0022EC3D12|nr:uncharacterized protein LOC128270572 [Anopheles cruzii]